MVEIVRTNSDNKDFINLVALLDAYLKIADGDDHDFYKQYNNIDVLKNTVVAYIDGIAVGCGAFKRYDGNSIEIKRMYTKSERRGKGVASKILQELENWSNELGYKNCILETGKYLTEAVNFYNKNGYMTIPNYGQYKNITSSICLKKNLG